MKPFIQARKFVRSLHLKNSAEWLEYSKSGKRPSDIPSNPQRTYRIAWKGYGDWLGTASVSNQAKNKKFLPFEEARAFARSLGLKSQKEWFEYASSGQKPDNIPCTPIVYKDKGFTSFGDWLGTGYVATFNREYLPFEEARAFARSLGLKLGRDWQDYCVSGDKPENIPADPTRYEEWNGIGDWLSETFVPIEYLPFEEARAFARSLGLKSQKQWQAYCTSGNKPKNIPKEPSRYEEYTTLADWLGYVAPYDRLSRRHKGNNSLYGFLPFEEARYFARSLSLQTVKEWNAYCKTGKKPKNIPSNPKSVYKDKGFTSFGDWLGTGYVATFNREYLPFEEARDFVHSLGLKTVKEWNAYCASGNKPENITGKPQKTYQQFFVGFGDWLGTGVIGTIVKRKQWLPFKEAREFARSLNFLSINEWRAYCKTDKKPKNIPSNPNVPYKNSGWVSNTDWLFPDFLVFEDARAFIHNLGLTSVIQFVEYRDSPFFNRAIPRSPSNFYKNSGWVNWGDFLGTYSVATRQQKEVLIQKYKEIVESLASCLPSLPTTAWWYILIQSGLDATTKEVKLLKKYQKGKLNLNELVDALISPDEIDEESPEIDALEAYGKSKTDFIAKANEILNHPLIAGLDTEAIAAIVAELQATIWDQIFRASMTGDISEKEEIFKLKEILKSIKK